MGARGAYEIDQGLMMPRRQICGDWRRSRVEKVEDVLVQLDREAPHAEFCAPDGVSGVACCALARNRTHSGRVE